MAGQPIWAAGTSGMIGNIIEILDRKGETRQTAVARWRQGHRVMFDISVYIFGIYRLFRKKKEIPFSCTIFFSQNFLFFGIKKEFPFFCGPNIEFRI